MDTVDTVYLISCVRTKRDTPSQAKDLYQSDWFKKARRVAEAFSSKWFILSARFGLVRPDDVISPYDQTLNHMDITARREWAQVVQRQMDIAMPNATKIVVFMSEPYREFLMDYLSRRADNVEVPMAGLWIGAQLRWMGRRVDHEPSN
jgi:cytoplasmic iron level regulating protein YaaA (DUF328/UPF0246 family)